MPLWLEILTGCFILFCVLLVLLFIGAIIPGPKKGRCPNCGEYTLKERFGEMECQNCGWMNDVPDDS